MKSISLDLAIVALLLLSRCGPESLPADIKSNPQPIIAAAEASTWTCSATNFYSTMKLGANWTALVTKQYYQGGDTYTYQGSYQAPAGTDQYILYLELDTGSAVYDSVMVMNILGDGSLEDVTDGGYIFLPSK